MTKSAGKSKKSTIWISYDLGIRGDYEGLYRWLDNHSAKECGDALAVLQFQWTNDLLEDLKKDLVVDVKLDKRARIYVIYRDRDAVKNRGKFIFGGRRAAAWKGYSEASGGEFDEEIG
ncbi:hypothetical protein [Rhizobium sp. NFR12]|uniref:hypothetical protein n=1 Tax=Rhizobium sp. NFR12 TaxID=1566261 RepID=UPI0008A733EA|nr:hypothetical protein [Rhizobium sp. NFR12]SEH27858.1 hypothetical protein SAMN03159407_3364 [Rhizobium sp. NFR12]